MDLTITSLATGSPQISTETGYLGVIFLLFTICLCLATYSIIYKDRYNNLKFKINDFENQIYQQMIKEGVKDEN